MGVSAAYRDAEIFADSKLAGNGIGQDLILLKKHGKIIHLYADEADIDEAKETATCIGEGVDVIPLSRLSHYL